MNAAKTQDRHWAHSQEIKDYGISNMNSSKALESEVNTSNYLERLYHFVGNIFKYVYIEHNIVTLSCLEYQKCQRSNVEVNEMTFFMCDVTAKVFTNDYVPCVSVLYI